MTSSTGSELWDNIICSCRKDYRCPMQKVICGSERSVSTLAGFGMQSNFSVFTACANDLFSPHDFFFLAICHVRKQSLLPYRFSKSMVENGLKQSKQWRGRESAFER